MVAAKRDLEVRRKSSMKTASVVIGAAFGDEGKGLLVDHLASKASNPIVVRFSGGANAGHTVRTPDGRKHVFSHFGSGIFAGAPTFLGQHFISNPILFKRERERLVALKIWSRVYVDSRAFITTPYDMLINQIAEASRGSGKHGSVGVGINETIERNQHPKFSMRHGETGNLRREEIRTRLISIREGWVPQRLTRLGVDRPINDLTRSLHEKITSNEIMEEFISDLFAYYGSTENTTPKWLFENINHDAIIFEGAQGLALDQNHAWFPHVTRANTGLDNVLEIAHEVGIEDLNVHYMHRAYATRHGAGPFPHELSKAPYPRIVDETNKPNPFQDSLRFGLPDLDLVARDISTDFAKANIQARAHLVVTCLDQVDGDISYVKNDVEKRNPELDFLLDFQSALVDAGVTPASVMTSHGPTRKTIKTALTTPSPLPGKT